MVADVDNDEDFEIGIGTNEGVLGGRYSASYLFDAATGAHAGWPRLSSRLVARLPSCRSSDKGLPASIAAADLDGDGDLEIADPVMLGQTPILAHDGTDHLSLGYTEMTWSEDHNVDVPSVVQMINNPSFGDLDGDGLPDPIQGGAGAMWVASLAMTQHFEFQHAVVAWSGVSRSAQRLASSD